MREKLDRIVEEMESIEDARQIDVLLPQMYLKCLTHVDGRRVMNQNRAIWLEMRGRGQYGIKCRPTRQSTGRRISVALVAQPARGGDYFYAERLLSSYVEDCKGSAIRIGSN